MKRRCIAGRRKSECRHQEHVGWPRHVPFIFRQEGLISNSFVPLKSSVDFLRSPVHSSLFVLPIWYLHLPTFSPPWNAHLSQPFPSQEGPVPTNNLSAQRKLTSSQIRPYHPGADISTQHISNEIWPFIGRHRYVENISPGQRRWHKK